MSNEEHVEEMYYFAHISGVFTEFSNKITNVTNNNPKKDFYEVVEHVFDEFIKEDLIQSDLFLFI